VHIEGEYSSVCDRYVRALVVCSVLYVVIGSRLTGRKYEVCNVLVGHGLTTTTAEDSSPGGPEEYAPRCVCLTAVLKAPILTTRALLSCR
jgi:hypothetical protein